MEKEITIQKCPYKWGEIKNKDSNNFCKYCKTNVPNLSNKSISQVELEMDKYTCARFHERHLTQNRKHYYFINTFESKLEKWGWVKAAASIVLVYLFIVGCGNRHRMAGAYADYSEYQKTKDVKIKFKTNHKELIANEKPAK